jgi:DNA repair protein RadC
MTIKEHEGKTISDPKSFASVVASIIATFDPIDRDKEHFIAIGLDARNKIKYAEVVSIGTANASLVHPREVFRRAIIYGVTSLIIGHNHPSGDTDPSDADLTVTNRLKDAGQLLGISLLDHVIVATSGYYSFKEGGKI